MKKMILLSFFTSMSAHAQFEALGILDRLMFELNFNRPSKSRPIGEYNKETPQICQKHYVSVKRAWLDKYKKAEGVVAEEGYFTGHLFTKEEMLNMPNENVHKVKQKIRGTDVLKYESVSSNIGYPHALPRCKEYFTEEVQKINVGDKACRRVIFRVPGLEQEAYAQIYCEGSSKLYISFDSQMEITPASLNQSNDCVECTKN